jgi:hypothetical protein
VVNTREHHIAHKGKNSRVGVQGAQPAKGQPLHVEIEKLEVQLRSNEHSDQHGDETPGDRGQHEHPDDPVVIFYGLFVLAHRK